MALALDEAFPNAEHIFKQAFAAEDPAPPLLQILKEHPTCLALRDLVWYYVEVVHEDPYRAQVLASALSRVINSHDAPSFGPDTLTELLFRELAGTHLKGWDDSANVYGPKNTHLLDSLLSGFALKYGLSSSPDMLGAIKDGLDAKLDTEDSEVLVVGTCIQLLLHGFYLTTDVAGTYQRKPKQIAKKLQAQQKMGTVKNPRAIEVLKLAINHAETGLLRENERDDVWSLLFPRSDT